MRSVTTIRKEPAMQAMITGRTVTATNVVRPCSGYYAATIRFTAGATVAVTGAVLLLADLTRAYSGTA